MLLSDTLSEELFDAMVNIDKKCKNFDPSTFSYNTNLILESKQIKSLNKLFFP